MIANRRYLLRAICFLVPAILISFSSFAQDESPIKPGKISLADFNVSSPLINEATGAIVIADIGRATLENYENGWTVLFKHTKRIKILTKEGFDACTIKLRFDAEDNRNNKLKNLDAVTYNLNGDKIEATPVPSKDFFLTRNKNSDILEETFTFPAVKAGSVIEYSYSIRYSNIIDLFPWHFQGQYPSLWSDYTVTIPDNFNYTKIEQGLLPYYKTSLDSAKKVMWIGNGNVELMVYSSRWIMKNIPEVKEEPLVYCPENYISKLHFQLATAPLTHYSGQSVLRSWQYVASRLLTMNFGQAILSDKPWLEDSLIAVTKGCTNKLDSAKKIFSFVRDNYESVYDNMFPHSDPREVFKSHKGNSADINLMLTAMLRMANIVADPVILSTRGNGKLRPDVPIVENLDYTVVRTYIDQREYFLDASEKKMGFGKLPLRCYNGQARVIKLPTYAVELSPDQLQETKITVVSAIHNDATGITLQADKHPGYYESLGIRAQTKNGKPEGYIADLTKKILAPMKLETVTIDSLARYEKPVRVRYNINVATGDEDLVYFNPVIDKLLEQNPLTAASRTYPVELPYLNNEVYELDMEIPKGYAIEEFPKSDIVYLNENDGSFEYDISKAGNKIQLKCKLLVHKTLFKPEEYKALRDFYAFIIKKQSEMIVFKKVK